MDDHETSESDGESSNMEEETTRTRAREQEEEERRREIIDAMDDIPNDMDFNDGCVLLDILYTMRKDMGIDFRYSMSDAWRNLVRTYKTDSDNRITTLHLVGFVSRPYFNLPPIVERLQKLNEIRLNYCWSIPKELDNLVYLECLQFSVCALELFNENMPEGIQLASLKRILLKTSAFFSPLMFELITNHMHTLEELCLWNGMGGNEEDSERILHTLQNENFSFRTSLKILILQSFKLKEGGLENLLFDVLPRFPNLQEIGLDYNQIESFQKIASRIKQTHTPMAIPDNCLRKLGVFANNPVYLHVIKIQNCNPKEKEALLTILNAFDEICCLGTCYDNQELSPDVEYVLRINHAGRKFITGGEGRGGTTANDNSNSRDNNNTIINNNIPLPPPIKPGLWPTILERAYEKSSEKMVDRKTKGATGMFYLLRNGSVLSDIITMRQGNKSSNKNEDLLTLGDLMIR